MFLVISLLAAVAALQLEFAESWWISIGLIEYWYDMRFLCVNLGFCKRLAEIISETSLLQEKSLHYKRTKLIIPENPLL